MDNITDLTKQEAIKKLQELAKEIDLCMFCTHITSEGSSTRPMSTSKVDDSGNIWFFSAKDSDKNKEIQQDNHVQLFYSHPGKNSFMVVNGTATISFDKQKIKELWSPLVKTWFKEGVDDPNISLIKIENIDAYYWDTKGNTMINFFKMIASVATGKTLVDAEEGSIKV